MFLVLCTQVKIHDCDVSPSVSTLGKWKFACRGGNRTRDLWLSSPIMLYHATELQGQVGSSARYFGTNLVSSISVCFHDLQFVVPGVVHSGEHI